MILQYTAFTAAPFCTKRRTENTGLPSPVLVPPSACRMGSKLPCCIHEYDKMYEHRKTLENIHCKWLTIKCTQRDANYYSNFRAYWDRKQNLAVFKAAYVSYLLITTQMPRGTDNIISQGPTNMSYYPVHHHS